MQEVQSVVKGCPGRWHLPTVHNAVPRPHCSWASRTGNAVALREPAKLQLYACYCIRLEMWISPPIIAADVPLDAVVFPFSALSKHRGTIKLLIKHFVFQMLKTWLLPLSRILLLNFMSSKHIISSAFQGFFCCYFYFLFYCCTYPIMAEISLCVYIYILNASFLRLCICRGMMVRNLASETLMYLSEHSHAFFVQFNVKKSYWHHKIWQHWHNENVSIYDGSSLQKKSTWFEWQLRNL